MKKLKRKISAFLLAFAMVLGVMAPSVARAAQTELAKGSVTGTLIKDQLQEDRPTETKLNIYKLTTQEAFSKNAPWDHNGGKIDNLTQLGTSVEYLDGIKFKVYKIKGTDKEAETRLNKYKKTPSNYKTVAQMDDLLTTEVEVATGNGLTKGETAATGSDNANGEAKDTGLTSVTLPNGYYWVVESDTSGAVKPVVGQIAVPFGITLPLMNSVDVEDVKAGTQYLTKVNVYPKNTQTDEPKIDKNFAKYDDTTGKWKDNEGNEVNSADLGAVYDHYKDAKKTISAELGKVIPYNVKTELPRNYIFETISWSDIMSEGLTYNKDLNLGKYNDPNLAEDQKKAKKKIQVTYKNDDGEDKTIEYVVNNTNDKLTETEYGFELKITKDQAKEIKGFKKGETGDQENILYFLKNGPVTFELNYSATVNKNTVVDKPQNNDITFTPGEPNPGGSVTPGENGEVTVTKTWANKDNSTEPKGDTRVTYYLIADDTVVASITLDSKNQRLGQTLDAGQKIKFVVDGTKWYSGKFTGLDKDKTYTIKEAVDGYEPGFDADNDATANITNTENPDVLKPTEPKVEYHGKKFVKADNLNDARLSGAEFKVYKEVEGVKKYLVAKTGTTVAAQVGAVTTAKTALDQAIETYNNLTAEQQKKPTEDPALSALNDINDKQENYNKAVKKASNKYEWGDKANAITLVSNAKGQFEITGLEAGDYKLEETKAPKGYAKSKDDIPFTVKNGSYTNDEVDISYDTTGANDAKKVVNKKMTIPQTGGIGTIIFTVIGLAVMGGAVVAMKRRNLAENK